MQVSAKTTVVVGSGTKLLIRIGPISSDLDRFWSAHYFSNQEFLSLLIFLSRVWFKLFNIQKKFSNILISRFF